MDTQHLTSAEENAFIAVKTIISLLIIMLAFVVAGVVLFWVFLFVGVFEYESAMKPNLEGYPNMLPELSDVAEPSSVYLAQHEARSFFYLPAESIQVAPDIFMIGKHVKRETGEVLHGFSFITREQQQESNKLSKRTDEIAICQTVMATGARWKGSPPPNFNVDFVNKVNVSSADFAEAINDAMNEWQRYLPEYDLFGNYDRRLPLRGPSIAAPDGVNTIQFGDLSKERGVIAVTIVWGIFSGQQQQRRLFEADVILSESFRWSPRSPSPGKMNLKQVLKHELGGHGTGLADTYRSICSAAIMYGYAADGETKDSLTLYDVNNMRKLYGQRDVRRLDAVPQKRSNPVARFSAKQITNDTTDQQPSIFVLLLLPLLLLFFQ